MLNPNVLSRIQAKTIIDGECWRYIGKVIGSGYMRIRYKGKLTRVARIACHLFYDKDLDDKTWYAYRVNGCKHYDCWNPYHLRPDDKLTGGKQKCSIWKRHQELAKDHLVKKKIEDIRFASHSTHSRIDTN